MEDVSQGRSEPIEVTEPYAATVNARLRDYVFDKTGCSSAFRGRARNQGTKRLCCSAPAQRMQDATKLAAKLIKGEEDIPKDWVWSDEVKAARQGANEQRAQRL